MHFFTAPLAFNPSHVDKGKAEVLCYQIKLKLISLCQEAAACPAALKLVRTVRLPEMETLKSKTDERINSVLSPCADKLF